MSKGKKDPKKKRTKTKKQPRKVYFGGSRVTVRSVLIFTIAYVVIISLIYGQAVYIGGDYFLVFGVIPFPLLFALETFTAIMLPIIILLYFGTRNKN